MRKVLYSLILIAGIILTYNLLNPPRSSMNLFIPVQTLEKLGLNARDLNANDLFYMLSADSSCKHEFSKHNYTVMFNQHLGNWRDVSVWNQSVVLYLTWQEIWQIKDEIYLCILLKDKWESAWKGKFSLKGLNVYLAHMYFFCNKENNDSKWDCNGYELTRDKKEEIYNLLTKYNE